MLSERDIEAAHPDAFDFVWGNLPAAERAEFSRHLSGCRYCQGVVQEYREIGRIITLLPPTCSRQPTSKTGQSPPWPPPWPGSRPRSIARPMPRTKPPPGPTDLPAPASGRARDPGPADPPALASSRGRDQGPPSARRPAGTGRVGRPADGHSPAGVAAPPRSLRRHGCRRRGHHRRRHRGPAQPWPGPGRSHRRNPSACHYCGQGIRCRRRQRPGDGRPAGESWTFDLSLDPPVN